MIKRSMLIPKTNFQLLVKRFFKKSVRVRFAPSPTGHLHLGGLRTALFNYLFARAHDGNFLLRIEDTDQTRLVPGAMEKLMDDLVWAGIISDEDPVRGGPAGPYMQSKRLDIYQEEVLKLLDNKTAYYCFCSESRLELLRKEAIRCGQIPKYDNRCRHLSKEKVKEKFDKGEKPCIRFKLPEDPETFRDIVYGEITHDVAKREGDPVIIKRDGYPTYHFANVVDDHYMEISHVLRGVEWQISTPKHIMLYKAFGWVPPAYGHLPLILNADGSKLSKRQNDITVDSYRKQGIFPLALINYIVHAGGGFTRAPESIQHLYTYEELIKQFNVDRINTNSSRLKPEILLDYNKQEIVNLLNNEKNYKFLTARVKRLVLDAFSDRQDDGSLQLDEPYVISCLKWAQHRISNLNELVTPDYAFLWVIPTSSSTISQIDCLDTVKELSERLAETDVNNFNKDWIGPYLRDFAKSNGISFVKLMKILRSVLSGLKDGPAVAEMIEILGKDQTLTRLRRFAS